MKAGPHQDIRRLNLGQEAAEEPQMRVQLAAVLLLHRKHQLNGLKTAAGRVVPLHEHRSLEDVACHLVVLVRVRQHAGVVHAQTVFAVI